MAMDRPPCLDAIASISFVVSPEGIRGALPHCLQKHNKDVWMSEPNSPMDFSEGYIKDHLLAVF